MDYLLNFKNRKYEAHYYAQIDPYLTKIVRSSLIASISVLAFLPYTCYVQFQNAEAPVMDTIRRTIFGVFIFVILGLVSLFIQCKKAFLRRHGKATRWGFDIFFNLVAGFVAFQFYDFYKDTTSPLSMFILGWWECLLVVTFFGPISRWYLKLSAYLIVILRVGISIYLATGSAFMLIKLFQMIILEVFLCYFHEKDRRRYFLEKQSLYEETKVYKEIFDLTSDGIIIYGLQEEVLFRNWSNEKHRWWKIDDSVEQNFQKILLKGFKKVLPIELVTKVS